MLINAIKERGFAKGILDLPDTKVPWLATLGLIIVVYLLSFWVRLEWIDFAQASYLDEQGERIFLHFDTNYPLY